MNEKSNGVLYPNYLLFAKLGATQNLKFLGLFWLFAKKISFIQALR